MEELQQLWKGVLTRDLYSSPPADFFLRAVIIWCIHDYPALGTMSGRTTHGYNACVRCDRNPLSYAILSKICYIGHRRFLAKDKPHPRKCRRYVFNAKHENRDAPKRLVADELQVELEKVRHITRGNHPGKREKEVWQDRREIIVYLQVHFVGLGVLERFGSAA